jgi:hypothetical protein
VPASEHFQGGGSFDSRCGFSSSNELIKPETIASSMFSSANIQEYSLQKTVGISGKLVHPPSCGNSGLPHVSLLTHVTECREHRALGLKAMLVLVRTSAKCADFNCGEELSTHPGQAY